MYFVESKHGRTEKMIRRTMSSAMNLLLIASFMTAPASIVLLPTLSFAAPLPLGPAWMLKIVANVRGGRLTSDDIQTLRDKSKDAFGRYSYKNLISIISRIDQIGVQQNSPYRLDVHGFLLPDDKSKVAAWIKVISATSGDTDEYNGGVYVDDTRKPMKKTSLQESMVDVTE